MRLPRIGRRGTYAPHAGGGNERVSRESRRSNRSIVRVSGGSSKLHEMNPRKHRAASHEAGGRARAACAAPAPLAPPATPKRNTQGWQDSHVVHDSRGLCSEKIPFVARSSRGVFPKGDLQGISDTWRANLAKVSSFWMHGGDMLPGRGAFPVRGTFWDT